MSRPLTSEEKLKWCAFRPKAHQREAHALRMAFRFLVLVWHRRAGKTVFAVMELVLAAVDFKGERGRFGYVAPFLNQAREIAWDYLVAFTREIPGVEVNKSELSVTFPNGARIRLYGSDNPDSLRGGYFDGVVLDEVADMRPGVWGEIVRPMLADRQGWCLFIGTPKGVNLFSQLYHAACKGRKGWAHDLRRAETTGMFSPEEIVSLREEMTEAEWAQEMDCDFAAAVSDTLITLPLVLAAQARTLERSVWDFAPRIIGVDCARYGDDESVIQPRQGLQAFRPKRFRGLDTMALAGQVAHFLDTAERRGWPVDAAFIDNGNMGAGVVDRLHQLGYDQVVGVDFGSKPDDARYENKRAEMWVAIRDWLKAGGALPNDEIYVGDLTAPKITFKNRRDKMQLESKDEMRKRGLKSPDVGDGLGLTFAHPVAIRTALDRAVEAQQRKTGWDYNPHARGG